MDRIELMQEAEKRGILPDDKKALLAEATKRGLVGNAAPTALGTADAAIQSGLDTGARAVGNIGMGALKGASDIGATLMRPVDAALNATGLSDRTNADRRASLKGFFQDKADPDSLPFKGGELAADIAGTAGVGGVAAKGVAAIPALTRIAPKLAPALESGGFSLGNSPAATVGGRVADTATRVGAGAAVGGASAGLINPDDALTGAALGGALPVAAKAAGAAGRAIAGDVSPDVQALYKRAKDLGIDVPADRIVNSKPLNAVASSLNYVPFSGRAATEDRMISQVNRAVSRTFGQDSDNVTGALRRAATDLGDKFEITLKSNTVKADNQLANELVSHLQTAQKELGSDGAKIISNQIDEILNKVGANGEIDGQAAYNIKKALDRIGNRNAPEAYYARELKKSLMGALNRSLGPTEAAAFQKVRQQYGNMLDLEGIAQNGAEGGVSIGRLANMKNINNPELQELADISAQFVKSRESPHGAAQRVVMGSLGLGAAHTIPAAAPVLAAGVAAGRVANTALNSETLKKLLMGQGGGNAGQISMSPAVRALIYNASNRGSP